MSDGTAIEWTDATWNPITGCSVHSAGCKHCYAMQLAGTRLAGHPSRAGLTTATKAGPVWTGEVRFNEQWLLQPLHWARPRRIFVVAHGDLFHESVPDDWIDKIFAVMALCPQHQFQVLTKRADRMQAYFAAADVLLRRGDAVREINRARRGARCTPDAILQPYPLPNAWLGVSVEDQRAANERIPLLLRTPAALRWVSAEPLLGPLDLTRISLGESDFTPLVPELEGLKRIRFNINALAGVQSFKWPALDWVVAGGENGDRPPHPQWFRDLRDQCEVARKPFLFKQWGSWGLARVRQSGTRGRFALASAGPHSDFWPAMVARIDSYPRQFALFGGATVLEHVGKKAAGRLLDGVEHNGFPA